MARGDRYLQVFAFGEGGFERNWFLIVLRDSDTSCSYERADIYDSMVYLCTDVDGFPISFGSALIDEFRVNGLRIFLVNYWYAFR